MYSLCVYIYMYVYVCLVSKAIVHVLSISHLETFCKFSLSSIFIGSCCSLTL